MYKPIPFFIIAIFGTWLFQFIAAYNSYSKGKEKPMLFFGLVSLCVPAIAALIMILGSKNQELIQDFWNRLFLFKINIPSLAVILLLMPLVVLLATSISLLFGKSTEQFQLADTFSVMERWKYLGLVIPFILAPFIEEIGWRGYGVDSLKAYSTLFTASILFGILWGLWHVPLFFIKGYYQNGLWQLGSVYVINFFISIIPLAFLTNWIFYTNGRSIPALVLFHSIANISSVIFKTEQFTKCIITALLCIIAVIVVTANKTLFFSES